MSESEFLEHAAMVRDFSSITMSETDTRVRLIDPVLAILGYRGVSDLTREVPVSATREFVDYVLRSGGQAQAIVEAKALKHAITDQHAAQCVQYAVILGVRWCLITNGITWMAYDAHAKGALPEKHVSTVHLDADAGQAAKAWAVLSLFARDSLVKSSPITSLLVERVVRDELARPDSPAVAALRRAVKGRFGENVSGMAIVDALLQIPSISIIEEPAEPESSIEQPKERRSRRIAPSGLVELISRGLLPEDAALDCKLYGVTHAARVRKDGQIELQGKTYATPSAAAAVLRGGKASNGWIIWRHNGVLLADLRAQLATKSEPFPQSS